MEPVVNLSALNFVREGHSFLNARKAGNYSIDELNTINEYVKHVFEEAQKPPKPTYKVGIMFVAINQHYWQYMKPVIDGVKQYFLPGHETEIMVWTDMQTYPEAKDVNYGATVFSTDTVHWPYPTLLRYDFFLAQEEYLKKFDYIFYLDLDMRVVSIVGDEILGEGLTAAAHPMYYLRQPLWFPYEPNEKSLAYIKQPGYLEDEKTFRPFYAAGGFQGGKTDHFLAAMHTMKQKIDKDMDNGYIARWNDESHWNRYLFDNPASVYLDPSYVYPDSLISEYYEKVWGRNFTPRIITLTKPFSTSKEAGAASQQKLKNM